MGTLDNLTSARDAIAYVKALLKKMERGTFHLSQSDRDAVAALTEVAEARIRIPITDAATHHGTTVEELERYLSTLGVDYDRDIDGPTSHRPALGPKHPPYALA